VPSQPPKPKRRRRILRWILVAVAALVLLPPLALVLIAWLEISISAGPWRGTIARTASDALGREVTLEGPLEFVPSLSPRLKVGGIRIANPPGFSTPEFASLGDARLWVDTKALLQRRLRVREITAENVRVFLEIAQDRRVNWALGGVRPAQPKAADNGSKAALEAAKDFRFEVETLGLRQLAVEFHNQPAGSRHFFNLDELAGEARRGQPIRLALRGSVEKRFPYTLSFDGGTADELVRPTKPWPFRLGVEFLGTSFQANGAIARAPGGDSVEVLFGLGTEDLREIERLLQTKLPNVGATALSGRVTADRLHVSISELRGVMGRTTLEGELHYDFSGQRPRVSGALSLPTLDLRPFLTGEREGPEEPPGSLLDTYRELEQVNISLRQLQLMDADLTLKVGRWLSLPGDVRDAELGVRLQDGVLRAPVQATIAGVPLRGEARVDGAAEVPSFDLQLGAQRTQLGGLAALLAGVQGVQGNVGRFLFRVSGRGENLSTLTRTVDVKLAIGDGRLSYGNIEGGRPVELRLDRLDVTLPGGRPLDGRIEGALLGEPFRARIAAGDLPTLARTLRSPLEISARATGAELEVKGVLAEPQANSGTDVQFRLVAPRAGDVGRWLGLSPDTDAPARLEGHLRVRSDEWRLDDFLFRLGRSAIAGRFAQVGIGRQPLIQARLDVNHIDVSELERLRPPAQSTPKPRPPEQTGSTLDIPILPRGIDLTDADIDVNVKRVAMSPADVVDASFKGRIREGKMDPSPFAATYAGVRFSGAIAVDLRGSVPQASLWVAASEVDVGGLLSTLKITEGLDARVEALRVQLIGRGSRLGEMLERSTLDADLDGGSLTLRDPSRRPLVAIALDKGLVRALPGQPVSVTLDGTIDEVPVAIRIASGAVRDVVRPGSQVPFSLEAQAAGARLDLQGKVTLPIQRQEGELTLRIAGERFDTLDRLARVALPPWGPWSIGGRFVSSERGYEVPDLELRVGESRLNGQGSYTAVGTRPRVDVALTAPRIQLDDFKFGVWSPFEKKKQDQPEKKMSVEEMRAKAKEAAAEGQRLLSPQTLRRLDAYLDVQVDEVLSGADRLGSGTLHAQLADGRLDFGPAKVNVPGGSALLSAAYEPSDTDVAVQMRIDVDRFDYGILARRIKPGTDLEGLFSLNFQLDSRAPTIDALMAHADGRVDFAVWPRNMRSGIFDLWAVNLFLALVPAVDPAKESKVNCAVGRFDLRDGKLTHDAILMDTSRMRVAGEGRVDFATETVRLRLAPKAKEPQFFSLATPIQVTGTLTDFKVGVAPGGVAETTIRFLTSVFVVPLEKLGKGRPPRDGSDVCTNAMRVVQRTQ
jgi:uncharacterized protein involved in outer membrane biogenesis